jgi:phosphoribosylformylglycinamidine cyclo-ligase
VARAWYQRAVSDDSKRDPYAQAGVSYAAMDPGKLRAQRAAEATAASLLPRGLREVGPSRGESAYVVDLGDRYLTTVTEALGTKNLVADAVRALTGRTHYDQIAADTVATILNDLCTVGGQPVCLSAYWGAGSSAWFDDQARMADLVDGWSAACNAAGCAWGGGETQVLTTMIDPATVVLGGSAVGLIAPKERLLLGAQVQAGDAILLAPSTGIHANGLTLARSVAAELPHGYATKVPGDPAGRAYGEVLLDPSPLYGPLVEALQEAGVALHYTAHVTGHGWRKLMRAPQAQSYVLERVPAVPPIFDVITRAAAMDAEQAYGTFNMGAGFAFFVAERDVAAAQRVAVGLRRELLHAGHVEAGPKRVVIRPLGLCFEGDSLQIRS